MQSRRVYRFRHIRTLKMKAAPGVEPGYGDLLGPCLTGRRLIPRFGRCIVLFGSDIKLADGGTLAPRAMKVGAHRSAASISSGAVMRPELATRGERFDMKMPVIVWPGYSDILKVDAFSPRSHRRAVWRFATYFQREFHYDFVQYGFEGHDDDYDHTAYLFAPGECVYGWRVHCIGATCFRRRKNGDAMQWIWLHPYFRRQGILTGAWGGFVAQHGSFDVEGPFSDAMAAFLRKRGMAAPEREAAA